MPNPSPLLAARIVARAPFWDPTLDDEQKTTLQRAYGVSISEQAWHELEAHLVTYSTWAAHENKAASVAELRKALQALDKACIEFGGVIAPHSPLKEPDVSGLEPEEADRIKDEARKQQEAEIQTKQTLLKATDDRWEEIFHPFTKHEFLAKKMLSDMTAALSAAGVEDAERKALQMIMDWDQYDLSPRVTITDRVRDSVNEMQITISSLDRALVAGEVATVPVGDAWGHLVRNMLRWAQEHGYPNGLTAGVNRTPSKIAVFFAALQKLMPVEYRRHMHGISGSKPGKENYAALTSAMKRADEKTK